MKLVDAGKNGKLGSDAKLVVEQYADKDAVGVEQLASVVGSDKEAAYNEVFARIEFLENKVHELQTSHEAMLSEIKTATTGKIAEFEHIIAMTGLNKDQLERQAKTEAQKQQAQREKYGRIGQVTPGAGPQGGPFEPIRLNSVKEADPELYFNMQKMMALNGAIASIPLDMPLKQYIRTTSGFGARMDPFRGALAFHSGVDLAGPLGAVVYASNNGRVKFTGWKGAYGNAIDIDHGLGFTTRYGHLRSIAVKPGQFVKKGQLIGVQGSTGRSTGNHLHYEVRLNDRALNPVNFLKAGNYVRTLR
jgi:murein DD-endopeptidase MepM/ murein hydrolase activator NlpD